MRRLKDIRGVQMDVHVLRSRRKGEGKRTFLNVMGIHGQVHGTDKTQPQVVDGVDGLVAPDPHEAHLLHQLHPPDLDHVGDGDLGQPEVLGGSVTDVYPIRHVQVWSDDQSEILPVDGQLDVDGDDAPDDVHDDGIDDDRINIDARLPNSRRRNQFGVHNWRAKWQ